MPYRTGPRIEQYTLRRCPSTLPGWDELEDGIMYYSEEFKSVKYRCPCGCGLPTYLLVTGHEAVANEEIWDFSYNEGIPHLQPSIQVRGGCNSHYFIHNGKTIWA